jgi:hypothetical protein
MHGAALAALVLITAALAAAAGAAPTQFQLVFDGHHGVPMGAGFRHEGPFTASPPFCSAGTVVDLQHQGAGTAIRLNTCADGSGSATMRVTNYMAEHIEGGTGTWRILEGTGTYATLRGKGTWTTVPIGGEDDRFRTTLTGIADLDDVAPAVDVSRVSAVALRRPRGAYLVTVAFSAPDNVDGNQVAYDVVASAGDRVWSKAGQTTDRVTVSLRIRPAAGTRRVRIDITASDPLDNESRRSRALRLPPPSR